MAAKTNILFCIDALARGGTELQLIGLIDRLDRSRFQPRLCTLKASPAELTPVDCPHLALRVPKMISPGGLGALWQLRTWLRREKIDVVHTFFQDPTIFCGTAARLAGVPVRIAGFRDLGFWRTSAEEWLLRRVYPGMTGFIANAEMVKQHYRDRDGIPEEKIRVIYNGIDHHALPWVDHQGPTRHIGIVGNLNRRVKRTDLFIKAAGLVAREQPDVTWHILGDGEFRPEFEQLAVASGLEGRIVFAGRVADVAAYLEKLQVGVICSDSEGFSNALLEYLFRGCAAVATAVGGNTEALASEENGLLVPPDDAEALAAALKRLIVDVPLRRRLAGTGRATAEATYSWDKCVAAHEAIYAAARQA